MGILRKGDEPFGATIQAVSLVPWNVRVLFRRTSVLTRYAIDFEMADQTEVAQKTGADAGPYIST
ncbi:MAG: hypothetical protein CMM59_10945 [Rhodospirillaceae bacterium]|nr:hypothetical protein [Rhodospirillaceae bacterium]